MIEWPLVSALVNVIELAALVWLLIHLRHSAAPHQAALIEEQRKELDNVRHNLGRMNTEFLENRRTSVDANGRIWEELRRINARLDEMRCPLGHPDCALNRREG